jgi:dienelactone hydrolase
VALLKKIPDYTDKNRYTMKKLLFPAVLFAACTLSCNDQPKTDEPAADTTPRIPQVQLDAVQFRDDTTQMNCYVAYDIGDSSKRPAVLVVPEWWGNVDFTRERAKMLASLGYIAITVDMYGNGKVADNPDAAGKMATPFYQDPQLATKRLEAAIRKVKEYPQTDTSRIAAIGFCFGGSMVLNAAKLGENFDAVVSFHGGLEGVKPDKNLLKAKVLVCHGGSDPFVPQAQVDVFKKQMDSVGADYTFKVYEGATHAFTNPDATANGKKFNLPIAYNPAADSASWKDMKEFFEKNLR